MRWKSEIYNSVAPVVLLSIITLLAGCSEKITGHQDIGLRIEIPTEGIISEKLLASVERYELLVEADDLPERLIFPLALQNGFVTGRFEIPPGVRRIITVLGLARTGVTIYRGSDTIDVISRQTIIVDIPLVPMVPVLTMTPRYQRVHMDSSFTYDFTLRNVPNFNAIRFDVKVNSRAIWFDASDSSSAVLSGDLESLATISYGLINSGINVSISSLDGVRNFAGQSGTTRLGTLKFTTNQFAGLDTIARVNLDIFVNMIGNTVDTMYQETAFPFGDEAEVVMWRSPQQP